MADDLAPEELAAALRRTLDDLDITRAELDGARSDLLAMGDRLAAVERRAQLGASSERVVANSELKARRRRLEARQQRFRHLARILSRLGILEPVERAARRIRARLRG